MTGRATIAFVVLCGAMFTGVLDPLEQGRNDLWLALATPVGALVGMAFAWRSWGVLAAPVALCFAAVVAVRGDLMTAAGIVVLVLPVLLAVAAAAVHAARRREGPAGRIVAVSFAVAALPLLWGTFDTVRRALAPELPQEVIAQLPRDESLGNLCPGASTPPDVTGRLRRQTEVLLREVREHPHSLVPYTYQWADTPPEHVRVTVRELAEEQLSDLRNGGGDCAPDLQRRLREAL